MKGYLDFLRYCLSPNSTLPYNPECIEWKGLMGWAEQQAIVGICFGGIEKLKKSDINIPFSILMEWIGYANKIEQQNHIVNKRCVELVKEFENAGFRCCLLKGQGNALLYDVGCKKEGGRYKSLLRQPGDIDLLVYGGRKMVTQYVRGRYPHTKTAYQHIDYPVFKDVEVELHCLPIYVNNPFYNYRLQKWFNKRIGDKCVMVELPDGIGSIPIPLNEFNIVYQLTHIMHHFFDEGIGLRQMMDYYYLLRKAKDDGRYKKEDVRETLKYLNLYKFAGAVMYIMKEVLGLEDKYLIVSVDERRGKTLQKEILKGGNFGHYSGLDQKNAFKKYFQKTWRNMKLVKEYPAEALCEPFFRTWHFFWRLRHR